MGACCSNGNSSLKEHRLSLEAANCADLAKNSVPPQEPVLERIQDGVLSSHTDGCTIPGAPNQAVPPTDLQNEDEKAGKGPLDGRTVSTGVPQDEETLMATVGSTVVTRDAESGRPSNGNGPGNEKNDPSLFYSRRPTDESVAGIFMDAISARSGQGQFVSITSFSCGPYPPSEAFLSCRSMKRLPSGMTVGSRQNGSARSSLRSSHWGRNNAGTPFTVSESGGFFSCHSTPRASVPSVKGARSTPMGKLIRYVRTASENRPPLVPSFSPFQSRTHVSSSAATPRWTARSQQAESFAGESAAFLSIRSAATHDFSQTDQLEQNESAHSKSPSIDLVRSSLLCAHVESSLHTPTFDMEAPDSLRLTRERRKKQLFVPKVDFSTPDTRGVSLRSRFRGPMRSGKLSEVRLRAASLHPPALPIAIQMPQIQETIALDLSALNDKSTRIGSSARRTPSAHRPLSTLFTVSTTTFDTDHERHKTSDYTPTESTRNTDGLQCGSTTGTLHVDLAGASQLPLGTPNPKSSVTHLEDDANVKNVKMGNVEAMVEDGNQGSKALESFLQPDSEPEPLPQPEPHPETEPALSLAAKESGSRSSTLFEECREFTDVGEEDHKEMDDLDDDDDTVDNNESSGVGEEGGNEETIDEAGKHGCGRSAFEDQLGEADDVVKGTLNDIVVTNALNEMKDYNDFNEDVDPNRGDI